MALAKTSNEIESIRGRFGGVYFKKDNSGQHIQAMPRHIYNTFGGTPPPYIPTHSFSRGSYINSWSNLAGLWGLAFVGASMATWAAFAVVFSLFVKSGVWKHVSGWNWFTHFNIERQVNGYLPYWKAPPAPDFLPPLVLALEGTKAYSQTPPLPIDDPTDYYWAAWWYNEKRSYQSDSKEWVIWWTGVGWVCSHFLGSWEGKHYYKSGDSPFGDYIEMEVPTPRIALSTP